MDTEKPKECSCRSKELTKAFGWTEIIIFTFATLFLTLIACIYMEEGVKLGQKTKNHFPTLEFWLLMGYCIIEVLLGAAVLAGNENENPHLLLLWTNARSISAALVFVGGMYGTIDGDGSPFLIALLYVVLSALLICIVDHRTDDIEKKRQSKRTSTTNSVV